MPTISVSLSIGFVGATHEDEIEIDQGEWDGCETEVDRNDLMQQYWEDWANNYIEGNYDLIE